MSLDPVSTGDPHVAAHNEEREAINDLQEAMPGKLDKPTTPAEGSFLTYRESAWKESISRLFEGEGQPQGQQAAPIGSRYIDTVAAEGAVEWLKTSGDENDNEGWTLLAGDTGYRNIAGLIDRRSTANVYVANLRRVNDVVDLFVDMSMPNNRTDPYQIYLLPVGFRPAFDRHGALQDNYETAINGTFIGVNGEVLLLNVEAGNPRDRFSGLWTTRDPWPTSLPGIELP